MMRKRLILGIMVASVLSTCMLSACGKETDSEQKTESIYVTENTTGIEEDVIKEDITEETSVGLKDYEGFYSRIETEEMEDYEVTVTHGYQFNGDGTGVAYGQDVVDFTWNETEIHFGDYAEPFTMEAGKLLIQNMEYEKIEGKLITPNPSAVDVDKIENGIYNVYIDEQGITEDAGKVTLRAEIFTEDSYDIVDINRMAKGDAIYINGSLLLVDSIEQTDSGIIDINGGIENCGSALRAIDESNCYVYVGMDMERSYTRQGIASLAVSDNVKLIDNRDPAEEKVYTGSDAILALIEIVKEYPLTSYDGFIIVENGEIVEIHRTYRP